MDGRRASGCKGGQKTSAPTAREWALHRYRPGPLPSSSWEIYTGMGWDHYHHHLVRWAYGLVQARAITIIIMGNGHPCRYRLGTIASSSQWEMAICTGKVHWAMGKLHLHQYGQGPLPTSLQWPKCSGIKLEGHHHHYMQMNFNSRARHELAKLRVGNSTVLPFWLSG